MSNSASAVEVMTKLGKEKFTSEYTKVVYGKMHVKENKIFEDLSHEEKLRFSSKENKYYILNIWRKTWIYIDELNQWVLISQYNTFQAEDSWNPEYVSINSEYILDVANEQLYRKI